MLPQERTQWRLRRHAMSSIRRPGNDADPSTGVLTAFGNGPSPSTQPIRRRRGRKRGSPPQPECGTQSGRGCSASPNGTCLHAQIDQQIRATTSRHGRSDSYSRLRQPRHSMVRCSEEPASAPERSRAPAMTSARPARSFTGIVSHWSASRDRSSASCTSRTGSTSAGVRAGGDPSAASAPPQGQILFGATMSGLFVGNGQGARVAGGGAGLGGRRGGS